MAGTEDNKMQLLSREIMRCSEISMQEVVLSVAIPFSSSVILFLFLPCQHPILSWLVHLCQAFSPAQLIPLHFSSASSCFSSPLLSITFVTLSTPLSFILLSSVCFQTSSINIMHTYIAVSTSYLWLYESRQCVPLCGPA